MLQEDWDALKAQMDMPYGVMKLRCDQFEVALVQQMSTKSKSWQTAVYVDGYFKGEWMASEKGEPKHEEARRFLRKVSRSMYTQKEIESLRKVFGKREAKKASETKHIYFDPYWKSFNSLKKHLVMNNPSIERLH